MASTRLFPTLLLTATIVLGACTSTETLRFDTPRRITDDPALQFDFTLPVLDDPYYRRVRVTVSFDGQATFYMRDNERAYKRIRAAVLTDEERRRLVTLFEKSGFVSYPVLVPRAGRLALPAHVVQLGYRSEPGGTLHTVSGAVSTQPTVEAYPAGFFSLIDGLADFVEERSTLRIHPAPVSPANGAAGSR